MSYIFVPHYSFLGGMGSMLTCRVNSNLTQKKGGQHKMKADMPVSSLILFTQ